MTFEIAFKSKTDTNNAVLSPGGFDSHKCKLKNDTRNDKYWITTVEDGHYLNGVTPSVTTWVKDSVATKANLGQDWYTEKDDIDLDHHLCVEPTSDENWGNLYEGYFACKEIRCEIRRNFNTHDYYDYDFVTNGNEESLDIEVGNAKLLINQSGVTNTNQEFVENMKAVSIKVVKSALSGVATAGLAVGALVASLSF